RLIAFFVLLRPAPSSTLFPYTTLFRSVRAEQPLLRRLFAPRAAREQRPAHDLRTVVRRPQRVLTHEERERVRDTAALNFQGALRSEEHTSELQSRENLVCRLLLEKKK